MPRKTRKAKPARKPSIKRLIAKPLDMDSAFPSPFTKVKPNEGKFVSTWK